MCTIVNAVNSFSLFKKICDNSSNSKCSVISELTMGWPTVNKLMKNKEYCELNIYPYVSRVSHTDYARNNQFRKLYYYNQISQFLETLCKKRKRKKVHKFIFIHLYNLKHIRNFSGHKDSKAVSTIKIFETKAQTPCPPNTKPNQNPYCERTSAVSNTKSNKNTGILHRERNWPVSNTKSNKNYTERCDYCSEIMKY